MKGSIKSHKSAIAVLLALALSGQSSWAAQNSAAVQGNDFLSSIQQIEVKQIDFPAPPIVNKRHPLPGRKSTTSSRRSLA